MSEASKSDRLVLFSDAVVAIAITLLVLPLVDAVPEAIAKHEHSTEVITENVPAIVSFVLSFVIIARFWLTHHRMLENVTSYPQPVIVLNLGWLFTIAVLPFPTEMIGNYDDTFAAVFYIGTMFVSSACQAVMAYLLHRHDAGLPPYFVYMSTVIAVLFFAALLLALIPGVELAGLLVLLLLPVVAKIGQARTRR